MFGNHLCGILPHIEILAIWKYKQPLPSKALIFILKKNNLKCCLDWRAKEIPHVQNVNLFCLNKQTKQGDKSHISPGHIWWISPAFHQILKLLLCFTPGHSTAHPPIKSLKQIFILSVFYFHHKNLHPAWDPCEDCLFQPLYSPPSPTPSNCTVGLLSGRGRWHWAGGECTSAPNKKTKLCLSVTKPGQLSLLRSPFQFWNSLYAYPAWYPFIQRYLTFDSFNQTAIILVFKENFRPRRFLEVLKSLSIRGTNTVKD